MTDRRWSSPTHREARVGVPEPTGRPSDDCAGDDHRARSVSAVARRTALVAELEFTPPEVAPVATHMARLAEAGVGWVNLQPGIPAEEAPPPARGLAILLASGPDPVPVCTWVPAPRHRRRPRPAQVGIQHGAGAWALRQIAATGLPLPEGWRCRQDNARRGLVLDVPADAAPEAVLGWLLPAGCAVATVELTGRWRARIHGPG